MNVKNVQTKVINSVKNAYSGVKVVGIKPTGLLATKSLTGILFLPMILIVIAYTLAFIKGYVSAEIEKLINVGIKIIDAVFVPTVVAAVIGFMGLWLDKNNNGIPDKLEDKEDDRK